MVIVYNKLNCKNHEFIMICKEGYGEGVRGRERKLFLYRMPAQFKKIINLQPQYNNSYRQGSSWILKLLDKILLVTFSSHSPKVFTTPNYLPI